MGAADHAPYVEYSRPGIPGALGGRATRLRHLRRATRTTLCSVYRCHVSPTCPSHSLCTGADGTLAGMVGQGHAETKSKCFLPGVDATRLVARTAATANGHLSAISHAWAGRW